MVAHSWPRTHPLDSSGRHQVPLAPSRTKSCTVQWTGQLTLWPPLTPAYSCIATHLPRHRRQGRLTVRQRLRVRLRWNSAVRESQSQAEVNPSRVRVPELRSYQEDDAPRVCCRQGVRHPPRLRGQLCVFGQRIGVVVPHHPLSRRLRVRLHLNGRNRDGRVQAVSSCRWRARRAANNSRSARSVV